MTEWATGDRCLAHLPPSPFSPHLLLVTGIVVSAPSQCSVPSSLHPWESAIEVKCLPYAYLELLLWILDSNVFPRHLILVSWLSQNLETQRSSVLTPRLSSASMAVSVYWTWLTHWYLFVPSSSSNQAGSLGLAGVLAETSPYSIFSSLVMRRCSLITRCWIPELISFVSMNLAKSSRILLALDTNWQIFHFQNAKITKGEGMPRTSTGVKFTFIIEAFRPFDTWPLDTLLPHLKWKTS